MNNKLNNFFNENSFTYDTTKISNEEMIQIVEYVKGRIDSYKHKDSSQSVTVFSPADEIRKYKELLDLNVITQEEFESKKKELLG